MRILAILMLCLAGFVMGYALRGAPASELPVVRAELERTRAELAVVRGELRELQDQGSERAEAQSGAARAAPPGAPPGTATPGASRPSALADEWAALERMADQGASARDWREFLQRLAADGSPAAVDVVLALMQDARVSVAPQLLADVLRDVDDPRIGSLARARLERVLTSDPEATPEIRGDLDLLAHHLDADGARRMLEWLGRGDALGLGVARHAGSLLAHASVDQVLGAASGPVLESPELYTSLAASREPAALLALETMLYAGQDSASLARAVHAGAALGGQLDAAELQDWSARFWSADAAGRAAVLHVLAGLDGNHTLTADEKRTQVVPILLAILLEPGDALLMPALRRVEYDGDFHVPELIGVLEGLREALPPESPERAYAMRVLAKLQKALAARGE